MLPSEVLVSLLCDLEGNVVVGNDHEKELLRNTINEIKDIEKIGRHLHINSGIANDDSCKLCGFDLRHIIHKRVNEDKKCPNCSKILNNFSGLENIPSGLYCPKCNDYIYNEDMEVICKLQ